VSLEAVPLENEDGAGRVVCDFAVAVAVGADLVVVLDVGSILVWD
jgi:hypothetical protein